MKKFTPTQKKQLAYLDKKGAVDDMSLEYGNSYAATCTDCQIKEIYDYAHEVQGIFFSQHIGHDTWISWKKV